MVEKLVAARMPKKDQKIDEHGEFSLPQIPEEEIHRLTIAEDLTECERIKLLLNKKDPLQQSYVFLNASNIFKDDLQMQQEIIPLILNKLSSYSEDIQVEAGRTFQALIIGKILNVSFAEEVFTAAKFMLTQWSKSILEAWIHVYASVLPLLQTSQQDRLPETVQMAI